MDDFAPRPELLVFAGPNGSGKSTITKAIPVTGTYINADDLQKEENISAKEAAEKATALKKWFIKEKQSFTFETVFSSRYNIEVLEEAVINGFQVAIIYVITNSPEINVERVKQRVLSGGHDVPEEKIRSRYHKSLENIKVAYTLADNFYLFDNSGTTPHLLIAKKEDQVTFYKSSEWSETDIKRLLP